MKISQRYHYLDLIKATAILFVCLYHFWLGGNVDFSESMEWATGLRRYCRAILGAGVPLFIMANGALVLNKSFQGKKHYINLLKLLLQFVFWRSVTILAVGIISGVDFSGYSRWQLINGFLLMDSLDQISIPHLWFVPLMICIQLLTPFLKKVFDTSPEDPNGRIVLKVTLAVLFALSFVIYELNVLRYLIPGWEELGTYGITSQFDPFSRRISMMLVYFLLGGLLHRRRESIVRLPAVLCIGLIFGGLAVSYLEWLLMSRTLGYTYDNIFNGYGSISTLLCSVCLFILAAKTESRLSGSKPASQLLKYIGDNTLTVYYLHWIIGFMVTRWMTLPRSLPVNTAKALILVAAGTAAGMLIKKIPVLKHLVH